MTGTLRINDITTLAQIHQGLSGELPIKWVDRANDDTVMAGTIRSGLCSDANGGPWYTTPNGSEIDVRAMYVRITLSNGVTDTFLQVASLMRLLLSGHAFIG